MRGSRSGGKLLTHKSSVTEEDLHAQALRHRKELFVEERDQAIQLRDVKDGKNLAADEQYFTVENDLGGWDVLSREQLNDRKGREKADGAGGSGEAIREPVDAKFVGGNGFREEDHVRTGSPDTDSSAVGPDRDTTVGQSDGASASEEDVQSAHSKMERWKGRAKRQAQVSNA